MKTLVFNAMILSLLFPLSAFAGGGAEGSNPLASVAKLDLLWTATGAGSSNTNDISAKGSFMAMEKLKVVYEFHYLETNVTGVSENGPQQAQLKPIYFPYDTKLSENVGFRLAVGGEWIYDFDNAEKGIGTGSSTLGPLLGTAFQFKEQKLVLIPLVQQFLSYGGDPKINQTAFRLIALKSLPDKFWAKLDAKAPYDWENDIVPANFEFEVGRMITESVGLFTQALAGLGSDRPYDWGVAGAVRINF